MKKQFKVVVAPEECKGCGRCVAACLRRALSIGQHLNDHGFAHAVPTAERCIGCGACYYACPEPGAITVWETPPVAGPEEQS